MIIEELTDSLPANTPLTRSFLLDMGSVCLVVLASRWVSIPCRFRQFTLLELLCCSFCQGMSPLASCLLRQVDFRKMPQTIKQSH